MRWGLTKAIWEKCRFTTEDIPGANTGDTTCVFHNVGTTVPESVMRHIYGFIVTNTAATYNTVGLRYVPDGATGTQWFIRNAHMVRAGDKASVHGSRTLFIPPNPDPLKPIMAMEGGSKLFAVCSYFYS